jgi:hypothetical protein
MIVAPFSRIGVLVWTSGYGSDQSKQQNETGDGIP